MRSTLSFGLLTTLTLLISGCGREPVSRRATSALPAEEFSAAEASAEVRPLPSAPVATRVRQADGMTMVWVAPGKFLMGSDESPYPAERPEHVVELDGFWIDRLEVANVSYRRCVEAGICSESAALSRWLPERRSTARAGGWKDAAAYCEWVGARLPTEAEWEKAARGRDGRLWPWGHEFDASHANLVGEEDGFKHTAPVGSFPSGASPYGLLDMAGNAAEWVADFWDLDYYESSPSLNPSGPAAGELRVYRSTIANGGGGPREEPDGGPVRRQARPGSTGSAAPLPAARPPVCGRPRPSGPRWRESCRRRWSPLRPRRRACRCWRCGIS